MAKKVDIRFSASMEVADLVRSLEDVKKEMKGIKMPADIAKNLNNALSNAEYSMKELQEMGDKPIMTKSALKQFNNAYKQATEDYRTLFKYVNQLQNVQGKFKTKESLGKQYKYYQLIEQSINRINESTKRSSAMYQAANTDLKKQSDALKEIKSLHEKISKAEETYHTAELTETTAQKDYEAARAMSSNPEKTAKLKNKWEQAHQETYEALKRWTELREKLSENVNVEAGEADAETIRRLTEAVEEAQKAVDDVANGTAGFNKELENLKSLVASNTGLKEFFDTKTLTGLENGIDDITSIEQLKQVLNSIRENSEALAQTEFHGTIEQLSEMERDFSGMDEEVDKTNTKVKELIDTTEDFGKVGQRALDFFALSNLGNIFGQIVQDARQAVAELDEVMTATAVVTNFSVGDMWAKLPEYTKLANDLGASTLGAYETTTLFYQQGLKTDQAMEIGAETMKMARIAGLDYAKATDYMTASLRGFNMELNAKSAEHINDVFSNLAAKTASNQQEMAEALTKTASIANSAGMSFETTSVLLAKMIETTRESPENLGTALKTVIGRFAEMKKATSDLITTEEGETISVNRVDSALQSVGIHLKDTKGQFRSLDEVFLELSQRWDTLDVMSQRYIATQAAGSRQQSRFIAMMENYGRTQELLGYAMNSSGAAAEQFDKTMESLSAKMEQLHNSWNTFVTSIADAWVIKTIVDMLNGVLTAINNITGALPGALNGLSKLLIGFLAFKAVKPILTGLIFDVNQFLTQTLSGKGPSAFAKGLKPGFANLKQTVFNKAEWTKQGFEAGTAAARGIQEGLTEAEAIEKGKKELLASRGAIGMGLATTEQTDAMGQLKTLMDSGITDTDKINEALNGIASSFGHINTEQAKLFQDLVSNGMPTERAMLVLQDQVLAMKVKEVMESETEVVAKQNVAAATLQEAAAERAEAGALIENAEAREVATSSEQMGYLQKIKNIALALFGNETKRKEALENLGLAATNDKLTESQQRLSAAMQKIPFGGVALGIIAIIAALKIAGSIVNGFRQQQIENAKATIKNSEAFYEENEKIKELNKTYQDSIRQYDGSIKAKNEYRKATLELAKALGVEVKISDLIAGNQDKIDKDINTGLNKRAAATKDAAKAALDANKMIVDDAQRSISAYGGFGGNLLSWLWSDTDASEAKTVKKEYEEKLQKSQKEYEDAIYDEAITKTRSNLNVSTVSPMSLDEIRAFYDELEFTMWTTPELVGKSMDAITQKFEESLSDVEYLRYTQLQAEKEFVDELNKSLINPVSEEDLLDIFHTIEKTNETDLLSYIDFNTIKGENISKEIEDAIVNARELKTSLEATEVSPSLVTALHQLSDGKTFSDLSDTLKKKVLTTLNKIPGSINKSITAQKEFNTLVNGGATSYKQIKYLAEVAGATTKKAAEARKILEGRADEANQARIAKEDFLSEQDSVVISKELQSAHRRNYQFAANQARANEAIDITFVEANQGSMNGSEFRKAQAEAIEKFGDVFSQGDALFTKVKEIDLEDQSGMENLIDELKNYQEDITNYLSDETNSKNLTDSGRQVAEEEQKMITEAIAMLERGKQTYENYNYIFSLLQQQDEESLVDFITANEAKIAVLEAEKAIFSSDNLEKVFNLKQALLKGEKVTLDEETRNVLSALPSSLSEFSDAAEEFEYLGQYINNADLITKSLNSLDLNLQKKIDDLREVDEKSYEMYKQNIERVEKSYNSLKSPISITADEYQKAGIDKDTAELLESAKDFTTYMTLLGSQSEETIDNLLGLASVTDEFKNVIAGAKSYSAAMVGIEKIGKKLSVNAYGLQAVQEVSDTIKDSVELANSYMKDLVGTLTKVGDGFITAADDAEELSEAFPGILQGAQDLHDGTIQLNNDSVKNAIENNRKIVNDDFKKNDELLENLIQQAETQLKTEQNKKEAVKKRVEIIGKLDNEQATTAIDLSNEVTDVLSNNDVDIVKRDEIAKAIIGGNWDELAKTMEEFPLTLKTTLTSVYVDFQNVFNDTLSAARKTSIISQLQTLGAAHGLNADYDWTKAGSVTKVDRGSRVSYYLDGHEITEQMVDLINGLKTVASQEQIMPTTNQSNTSSQTQPTDVAPRKSILDLLNEINGIDESGVTNLEKVTSVSTELIDAQIKAIEQNIQTLKDQRAAALFRNQEYNRSVDNLLAGLGGDPNKDVRDRDKSDPLYNIKSELAQLQKAYDDAQQAYTDLLNNPNSTAEQIQAGVDKVNAARKALTQGENVFKSSALSEIDKLMQAYPEFANLYSLNRETGQLTINNAGIDSLPTATKEKFDNFFGKLESYVDSFAEGLDSITDLHRADEEFNTVWDTGYKSFVNLLQRIEEREAYQEKLDSDYEALLESRNVNAKKVSELLSASVQNLNEQLQLYSDLEKAQQYDLDSYVAQNKSFQKYVTYDKEHNAIRINNDALKQITNKEQLEAISKIIEEIKTRKEAHDETNKKISEVKKTLQEQQDKGRDEYITLVNKIRDIVKESRQQEIDRLENINDSINEANSRLMDAVRENIDKIRQDRKNEKTEQEIGNTAAKLAYLSQSTDVTTDTKEILDLRKSLEDQTESYSDTLVDQQLNNVEKANEKAQQQREDQIKLLTDQLEQDEKIGVLMVQAERELETLTKSDGTFNQAAEILTKLKTAEGYEGLSQVEKMKWLDDFKREVAQAGGYTRTVNQLENLNIKKGITIQFEDGSGNLLTGTYQGDNKGTVTVRRNNKEYSYDNVYQGQDKLYRTDYGPSSVSTINSQTPKTSTEKVTPKTEKTHVKPSDTVTLKSGSKYYPDPTTPSSNGTWDQTLDHKVDAINGKRMHLVSLKGGYTSWVDIDSIDKINGIKAYKTGGLVTDTGLAWLDGTRANPEYVLNADITKLMFETLGHLQDMQSTKKQISNSILSKTQNIGATNVEININVDKISSDYDVTQLAEQIKQNIAAESMYRNVNTINFLR